MDIQGNVSGQPVEGGLHLPSPKEPTEPGFYKYSGGRQTMIFLRLRTGGWKVVMDQGTIHDCSWGYIEQALGVWTLERIS